MGWKALCQAIVSGAIHSIFGGIARSSLGF